MALLQEQSAFLATRYNKDGERLDNVTDWAMRRFREVYGKDGTKVSVLNTSAGEESGSEILDAQAARSAISKDDIFAYVYGVLHDPAYRETYALNLKREFPRIPFYRDFWQWARIGPAAHVATHRVRGR